MAPGDRFCACIEAELRKLPRRQDLLEAEYEQHLAATTDEIAYWARIVHSGIAPNRAPASQEEVEALRKFAAGLDGLVFSLSYSEPLCAALTAAALDPEAMRTRLDEMLGTVLAAYAGAEPRKRGRSPSPKTEQALIDHLATAYSGLTGKRVTLITRHGKLTGGYYAFVMAVLKTAGLERLKPESAMRKTLGYGEKSTLPG